MDDANRTILVKQQQEKADNCSFDITEEEINDIRPLAKDLVSVISNLLESKYK